MIANRESIETAEAAQYPPHWPCERDWQIYAAVRVDGRRQVDVAAEFGITQGRVSQIVRSVNDWRVGMDVEAELERRDRKSVDRWLEQLRIEKLYEETMELYRRSCQPRRKERRGKDHRGEWSAETLDHQPGNLQCLKFAGRLLELRSQLDQEPPPAPVARTSDDPPTQLQEYDLYLQLSRCGSGRCGGGTCRPAGPRSTTCSRCSTSWSAASRTCRARRRRDGGPPGRGQRRRGSANGGPGGC